MVSPKAEPDRVAVAVDTAGSARRTAWTAFGASVRGASHIRDGLPNQDAIALWTADDTTPRVTIVSIADGHGGPRHFRSAAGARFAVDETVAVLRTLAATLDAADPSSRAHLAAVELPRRIVEGWIARTRDDLAANPLTDAELHGVAAAEGEAAAVDVASDPLLAYGATLLAAMVTDRCIVMTQLGDGDLLAVDADGTTTRPLPTDERLSGNMTTSICRAGAESDFRSAVVPRNGVQAALLLSTDGYANSFRSDADFLQVGRDFAAMIAKDGMATVDAQLEAILRDASAVGSGDDITLGILQCVDASPAATRLARRARTEGLVAVAHDAASDPPSFDGPGGSSVDARLVRAERHVMRMRLISGAALLVALFAIGWTYRESLADWFHADTTKTPDGGKGAGTGKDGPAKPRSPKGDGGMLPLRPEGDPEAKKSPGGVIAAAPPAAKGSADGGVIAPPIPKIEEVQTRRVTDGIRVTAQLAFDAPPAAGCRFEATVWDAKDRKLESATAPLTVKAKAAGPNDDPDEGLRQKAMVLVAYPKDAAEAKALKAKDALVSSAVACDGQSIVQTPKAPIGG